MRFLVPQVPIPQPVGANPRQAEAALQFDFQCGTCKRATRIQANLVKGVPLEQGRVRSRQITSSDVPSVGLNIIWRICDARSKLKLRGLLSIKPYEQRLHYRL